MIEISSLHPGSPEIATCARWRVDAFSVLGASAEKERRSLETFTRDQEKQVALVAKVDGVLAGTCLLVPSEIASRHDVSPWLAGLYVVPERRRSGVGAALVHAIEREARARGFERLYLYATDAADYYARLGWHAQENLAWQGRQTTLMLRVLS